jgi:hypothetical protein
MLESPRTGETVDAPPVEVARRSEPLARRTTPSRSSAYSWARREPPLPSPLPTRHPANPVIEGVRVTATTVATIAIIIASLMLGYAIAGLTQVDQGNRIALGIVAPFIAAGAMGLAYAAAPRFAKILFAMIALLLVTSGVLMMVYAPVVRQMNTPDLAEYRAFNVFLGFGLVGTVAGLALGALCVRWALQREARRQLARSARMLGIVYGVLQGLSGLALVFTLLFVDSGETADYPPPEVVLDAIGITSVALIALVPGLILTWHGVSSAMGEGSAAYSPPIAAAVAVAFAGVLALGGLNMAAVQPVAAPMPLLHALAGLLPGVALVALASRGSFLRGAPVRGLTWRQVTLAAAIAMTVGVWTALYVEGLGGIAAVVLLLVHNGAFVDAASFDDVQSAIEYADLILTENEQFAANLIVAAVLAPLSEEFGKGLGVRFMMRGPTTRAQAFALGAAAGAGFGFLEALLYGVAGVEEGLGHWWEIMLIRGGSSSLHVLATGLVGLAWWHWSVGRQRAAGWRLFGLAVLLHAVWNAFAVTLFSKIFGLDTLSDRTIAVLAYGVVAVVSLAFIAAIVATARRLREPTPARVEGTALEAMAPWLGEPDTNERGAA